MEKVECILPIIKVATFPLLTFTGCFLIVSMDDDPSNHINYSYLFLAFAFVCWAFMEIWRWLSEQWQDLHRQQCELTDMYEAALDDILESNEDKTNE